MPMLSRFRVPTQEDPLVVGERPLPHSLHRLLGPPQMQVAGLPTPVPDVISLSQHYSQMARALQSLMPSTCRWLSPEDVKSIGDHPMAAGGIADIWEAMCDGSEVVLKSYRCYIRFDVAQAIRRYYNEVRVCSLLHHRGVGVVVLVGAYSTETHPFGLIYEYMDGLDLKQYLRNKPHVERLKLLADIAQDLNHMHGLGIVHGGLKTTNVLVNKDGTPRLAGLGNAHILSNSTTWMMEGRAGADRTHAPELTVPGVSSSGTEATHPTKASDMYAFGVMAFEVLTGHPPFFKLTEIAAVYSMLKGDRPHRPSHFEISDAIWGMIEQCWHSAASQRMPIGEAVRLLLVEVRHRCDP